MLISHADSIVLCSGFFIMCRNIALNVMNIIVRGMMVIFILLPFFVFFFDDFFCKGYYCCSL